VAAKDSDMIPVAAGVADEVGDATLERLRADPYHLSSFPSSPSANILLLSLPPLS